MDNKKDSQFIFGVYMENGEFINYMAEEFRLMKDEYVDQIQEAVFECVLKLKAIIGSVDDINKLIKEES